MSRRGERDLGKERFWRRMVRQWRRSRLTIRAFCGEHQLSEPSFYGWRRAIAARDQESTGAKPAARRGRARRRAGHDLVENVPAFVPVQVVPTIAANGASLEVVLGNGRVLRVASGFDTATLRQLLACLEGPSC